MSGAVMDAKGRLEALQVALKQRDVHDVKFFFNGNCATPPSDVADDAANLLQAYINGEVRPMGALNDTAQP